MNWYYSNCKNNAFKQQCYSPFTYTHHGFDQKVGPFKTISELKALYGTSININTMVANNQTIYYWTELNKLPQILPQLSSTAAISNDEYFRYVKSHQVTKWNCNKSKVSFIKENKIYGSKEISSTDSTKHIWEFQVDNAQYSYALWIGIDSSMRKRFGEPNVDYKPNENVSKYYEFNINKGLKKSWKIQQATFGVPYKTNASAIICMILDLSEQTLSFGIDGNQQQIAFHKVVVANNMKYSCCITGGSNCNVTLLDYTVKGEEKQNDNHANEQLKRHYESIISSLQSINVQQQQQIVQLQQSNNNLTSLQNELKLKLTQLQNIQHGNNAVQSNNNLINLQNELQTIKNKLSTVENENASLKLKLTQLQSIKDDKKKKNVNPVQAFNKNDGNVNLYQQQINKKKNLKISNNQQNAAGMYGQCNQTNCSCIKYAKEIGIFCKCGHKQSVHIK